MNCNLESKEIAIASPRTADVLREQGAPTADEREALRADIKRMLRERDAVLVAHYYTHPDIQELADETGGCVSDSLDMARFGNEADASTLVVAGVRFMGETAKILNPEKRVIMPTLEATCSLDLGCPADRFAAFCDRYPEHTVVVYANTSAAVKARADWVVTSGIALKVAQYLHAQGEKIIWAPDKHLGDYVRRMSGVDMVLWPGSCIVHDEFKARELHHLRAMHPEAAVLVHPESPADVIEMADVVGSTTQLINAACTLPNDTIIVATDRGIFHKMREAAPRKTFIEAPTGGVGATCKSCAHCPWMAMNDLRQLAQVLVRGGNEITVPEDIRRKAVKSVQRMLDFARANTVPVLGYGNA